MKDQRHNTRHSVSLILALVGSIAAVVLVLAPSRRATAQATASWTFTGNLNEARWSPLVTQLQNGKVLVAGGYDPDSETYPSPSSAELYDPATGTWSFTGNLNGFYSAATTLAGVYSTATTLANGKVLVVGGTGSTELYDPATGTWTNTGDPSIVFGGHREVPLPNGRLLMVGGYRTELYDPDTGTWSVTGSQHTARSGFTATVLPNGKVLIAGGSSWFDNPPHVLNSAELYDPTTGNWSFTGNLNTGRDFHAATLLSNGKALVVGGVPCLNSQCSSYFSSSELYDPLTGTWSYTGNVNTARAWDSIISSVPSVLPLPNGKVLIMGGHANAGYLNSAELYDSATGNWSGIASPNRAREAAAIAPLPNGKILVAGGETCNSDGCSIDDSAELYDSGPNPIDDPQIFVTQQYRDFLGREPDSIGLQNWVDTLVNCPNGGYGEFDNPQCDRVHVSAGFFQSNEFLGRGYWILRFGFVGLNRSVGSTRSSATYAEFVPALQQIGGSNSPAQEEAAKAAYTNAFVQRSDFQTLFPASLSNSQYVNALEMNAGVILANKQSLIDGLNNGAMTRADVLRNVVESQVVFDKYIIPAFVDMEYKGYLRRDPDTIGYQNWVNTLTADPSNYRHMVFGFIYSAEYRSRFGTP